MTLDLPPRLATDWLTWALALSCGAVVEAVAARYPAMPAGGGIAAFACLALWHWARTRPGRVLRTASLQDDGSWRLQFGDGHRMTARLSRGTRVLGRSIVLRWAAESEDCAVWLTPWDLPDAELRRLAVRLRAMRHVDGAPRRRVPTDP